MHTATQTASPTARVLLGPDLNSPDLMTARAAWRHLADAWARTPSPPASQDALKERLTEAERLLADVEPELEHLPPDEARRLRELIAGLTPLLDAARFVAAVFAPAAAPPSDPRDDASELWSAGLQGARVLALMGGQPPRRLLLTPYSPCPEGAELGERLSELSRVLVQGWRLVRVAQPFQPDPRLRLSWPRLRRMAELGAALTVTPEALRRGDLRQGWAAQVDAAHQCLGRALEIVTLASGERGDDARPPLPTQASRWLGEPPPERPQLSFADL